MPQKSKVNRIYIYIHIIQVIILDHLSIRIYIYNIVQFEGVPQHRENQGQFRNTESSDFLLTCRSAKISELSASMLPGEPWQHYYRFWMAS